MDEKNIREGGLVEPRVFVTTDTHGCYNQLLSCLVQAKFDYNIDKLIHLGDIVDRGVDSFKVVELLLSVKNRVCIKGNHDDWFNEWLTKGKHPGGWLHGGEKTIESYAKAQGRKIGVWNRNGAYDTDFNNTDIPIEHRQFFANQVNYYIDEEERFFCHAGYNPRKNVESQEEFVFYWDRDLITVLSKTNQLFDTLGTYKDVNEFKRVFIGHTPTISLPGYSRHDTPLYISQLVDLDTGGCFSGKISLIDITDDDNHVLYQA